MWPKIMSSVKLSFFICYFPLWQHNRCFKRCYIKTGPTRPCHLETYPVGFWASSRTAIPRPIWASLLISTLIVQSFPRFSQIFPCCSWWLLPLVLLLHTTQRHPATASVVPHHLLLLAAQKGSLASPPTPLLQPQRCLCLTCSSLPTSVWYRGSQRRHWRCDVPWSAE